MRIAVGLGNQTPGVEPTSIAQRARLAEDLGFASLASVGRIAYPGVMDTVALAVAAGATTRIGLFTGILVAPSWGPALLAKELASIDAVSGHRLTVGIGIGSRRDDYPDFDHLHRGRKLDSDLQIYGSVWRGEPIGTDGGVLMPHGAEPLDLFFGGISAAALRRVARSGVGYVGASWPAELVASFFEQTREAWTEAGRAGQPRLRALTYSALSDPAAGIRAVSDYYADRPDDIRDRFTAAVCCTETQLADVIAAYEQLGVEELIINPAVSDPDEYCAVASAALG